jgi:hypothetical protein
MAVNIGSGIKMIVTVIMTSGEQQKRLKKSMASA